VERFGADGEQLQPWSEEIQASLLAELQAAGPDLVLHLGDLTCGGGAFEMPDALFFDTVDHLYQAFQALPADFSILPGNHDGPAGSDWSYVEDKFGLGPGLGRTIDLPTARLILLNAQGHSPARLAAAWPGDPTYGWVSEAELARLDTALATAGERPVLLFVHQLLKPWLGEQPWKELYGVENAEAVLEILTRHSNVRAVFQAHAHRLDVQSARVGRRECWFIISPAIIVYPLAWLQLDLTAETLQVTMRQLPLSELAELSRQSGEGHDWRAGRPEWQNFIISLTRADE
jgi:Icc protein